VLDDFYPKIYTYKLRAGQELIQLWHAVGAFKTFGFSRLGMPGGTQVDSPNHRNYTKAIVSSDEVSEIYAEAFGIPVENIVATGIPRTDVFFDQTHINARKQDLLNEYPYLRDKKVILFAPTFRGNGQLSATYDYRALDLESIYEAFKDTHVFIFKMHPFILDRPQIPRSMRSFFYDLSCHDDINELMFISDILITDYSSACFEYSLLNKPMIFFSYDLKNYLIKRNFYYNYVDFVPGPIALDSDQLIEFIREDKVDQAQLSAFREKYFNHFDGQSSRRVVDEIILPLFPNEH
jgi:CDP-ribitol ribitolphosphotransferase